jgi:hypothetical protein
MAIAKALEPAASWPASVNISSSAVASTPNSKPRSSDAALRARSGAALPRALRPRAHLAAISGRGNVFSHGTLGPKDPGECLVERRS